MNILFATFAAVVRLMVYALDICLVIRAILSWFPDLAESTLGDFVYTVTEPLVGFVRSILMKLRFFREMPFDFSVFFSCLLLGILLLFL